MVSRAPSSPRFYTVFGERLSSEIEFPELRSIEPSAARWTLVLDPSLPEDPEGTVLGRAHMYDEVYARLSREDSGPYWFRIDDTGVFRIDPESGHVRFRTRQDPWWDFGRAHFLGGVLGTLLHLAGEITLHASAVRTPDGTVAFLAPKGAGKSTLALSLVRRGHRLVTDDDLVVQTRSEGAPTVRPGIPSVRLTRESRERVGVAVPGPEGADGKATLSDLPDSSVEFTATKLTALYLIAPAEPDPDADDPPAAHRERLPTHEGALLLHGQEKIGVLLGRSAAPSLLDRVIRIAERVPVYRLDVVRDMERLDEVANQIESWHGNAGTS